MPLTAYLPLEQVYVFHQAAERWVLRRYAQQVAAVPGAGRRRKAYSETWVDVFPERNPKRTEQVDAGQQSPERRKVYLTTRLRLTDTTDATSSDVLFDPEGAAWTTSEDGRWDEARGYEVTLTRAGRRGLPPFA